jgi:hypothetical protein
MPIRVGSRTEQDEGEEAAATETFGRILCSVMATKNTSAKPLTFLLCLDNSIESQLTQKPHRAYDARAYA